MKNKNKKLATLITILSFSATIASVAGVLLPKTINVTNNSKAILDSNSLYSITPRYNAITKFPETLDASATNLEQKFPIELITTNSSLLKQFIIENIVDPSTTVVENDIRFINGETVVYNLEGRLSLAFNLINNKAVINNNGSFITTSQKKFVVEINNLKKVSPSTIPTNNATIQVPATYSSYTCVQANPLLQNEIIPTIVGGSQLSSFAVEIIESTPIYPDKLSLKVNIANYFDSKGELINYSGEINFTISGFKSLVNSTHNYEVDASNLGVNITDLNLENTFPLIKSNINNLSKELTINDIQNLSIQRIFSARRAILDFDIVNGLWVENAVISTKHIQMVFTNLPSSLNTSIDNIVSSAFLNKYTSSEVKATSLNGDWKTNSTLKTILASSIVDPATDTSVSAVDIDITSVVEKNGNGTGNYSELFVKFNLINSSGFLNGKVTNTIPLSTTVTGFKLVEPTYILDKIIANSQDTSNIGIKSYRDIFATDLTQDQAKLIIASNIYNPNGIVSANDIQITSFTPNLNAGTIDVTFNLNNSKFIDTNGDVLFSTTLSTQIFGLKLFNGATNFVGLSNNLTLDNNSSFPAPFTLPPLTFANRVDLIQAIIRSFISGPVPKNLTITINNPVSENNTTLKFDVAISNYYDANGIVTTPKVFTNIKITNLPLTPITTTFIHPIIPITTDITIDDLRPVGNDYTALKNKIAINIVNPFNIIQTEDIEIVSTSANPNYSGSENSVLVTFKIINNKYKDQSGSGTNSPELKVKFVNFTPVFLVNSSNYTMQTISNSKIANMYASEFLSNEINTIQNSTTYTTTEKNLLLQNLLSQYVSINLSNLDLNKASLRFSANDTQGSLSVSLYSYGFYNQSGSYVPNETPIATINLTGFATNKTIAQTEPQWSSNSILQLFASDVSLFNVSEIVTFNNLPAGVVPQYLFEATNVVVENGIQQNYGNLKITVTLSSYFNSSGQLMEGPRQYTREFKTLPFLNTDIVLNDGVLVNYSEKSYKASSAPEGVIKKIISLKLKDLPSNFNLEKDITILSKEANDASGEMIVSFEVSNYYKDGVISLTPIRFDNIKIIGFYPDESISEPNLPFYKEQWFWLLSGVSVGSLILLCIIFIAVKIRKRR